LPLFLRKTAGNPARIHSVKKILREERVHTVCEEARCPNMSECFSEDTATFLLLGGVCTRKCSFCAVEKGCPSNKYVGLEEQGLSQRQ
jgi:lipoic acid synthetase